MRSVDRGVPAPPHKGSTQVSCLSRVCAYSRLVLAEFTYGMPSKRDPESAGEVVLTWVEHTKSKYQKELGAKDFVRMNKQSIGNACVTSKEVTGYRKEHDMRVPKTKNRKPPKNEIPTSVEERTFGSRSKADTGVNDLITNRFALEWVTEQQQLMVVRSTEGKPAKSQRQKRQYIHPVRSPVEETPKASYTLNKYRGVPARTLTTRTPVPTASARVKLPPISHTPEPVSS